MAKQSLSSQSKGPTPSPNQRRSRQRVMLALAIGLCLFTALVIMAQQPARKAPRKAAPRADTAKVAAQTGFSPATPAKEYIYAGGKLLATEEQVFADVPTGHPFFNEIDKIAEKMVTLGCDAGPPRLYCPNCLVTRAEMAIFIERTLGVFNPPPGPATPTFADVPNSGGTDYAFEFIEDFVTRGITVGCIAGPPRYYCPTSSVTHAEMAIFMCRARGVSTFDPNAPLPPQTFCDVPTSYPSYRFIDYYVNTLGIWPGCEAVPGNDRSGINACQSAGNANCTASCTSPSRKFCPNCAVTRAEMAYILVHAFNL